MRNYSDAKANFQMFYRNLRALKSENNPQLKECLENYSKVPCSLLRNVVITFKNRRI